MTDPGTSAVVLLVEDNPANLLLAEEILKLGGYRTQSAASAEQAEALIVKQVPDLVVLDIRLPGTDGLTFMRKLRASPLTQRLPVVALTAQAMADERAAAMHAGFDAYVVKPVRRDELLSVVRQVLADRD